MLQILIPREHWSPIEDIGPPPEYVPKVWDGPHVIKRVADGFDTLRALPAFVGPAWFKTLWPAYAAGSIEIDPADAQALALGQIQLGELEMMQARQNKTRVMPSCEDVSRMERVLIWPARYLGRDRARAIAVQLVARIGGTGAARWLGGTADLWLARAWSGSAIVAAGLNGDGVEVF